MKHDVFEYQPGAGDYGSDWRLIYSPPNKKSAVSLARIAFDRDQIPLRIFTAPKRAVGRMVAEFGSVA